MCKWCLHLKPFIFSNSLKLKIKKFCLDGWRCSAPPQPRSMRTMEATSWMGLIKKRKKRNLIHSWIFPSKVQPRTLASSKIATFIHTTGPLLLFTFMKFHILFSMIRIRIQYTQSWKWEFLEYNGLPNQIMIGGLGGLKKWFSAPWKSWNMKEINKNGFHY